MTVTGRMAALSSRRGVGLFGREGPETAREVPGDPSLRGLENADAERLGRHDRFVDARALVDANEDERRHERGRHEPGGSEAGGSLRSVDADDRHPAREVRKDVTKRDV